jgi:hypothetical protein
MSSVCSAPGVWPCVGTSIHIINNADTHTCTLHRIYTYVAYRDPLPYPTLSFPPYPFHSTLSTPSPLPFIPTPLRSIPLRTPHLTPCVTLDPNEQGYPCPTCCFPSLVQTRIALQKCREQGRWRAEDVHVKHTDVSVQIGRGNAVRWVGGVDREGRGMSMEG